MFGLDRKACKYQWYTELTIIANKKPNTAHVDYRKDEKSKSTNLGVIGIGKKSFFPFHFNFEALSQNTSYRLNTIL